MDWQKLAGGLIDQVTGNKSAEDETENKQEGQGLMGLATSALSALTGEGGKGALVGQLLNKVGGSDLQGLLEKLGINPDVANDPDSASNEDLEKIAAHLNENSGDESEATSEEETVEANSESEEVEPVEEATEEETVEASSDDSTESSAEETETNESTDSTEEESASTEESEEKAN